MEIYEITGGKRLNGELTIQGSKNAVLPILAACILNKGMTVLKNCPKIEDVYSMMSILNSIGCHVVSEGNTLIIDTRQINLVEIDETYTMKLRSSILLLAPLLSRCKEVKIAYPGGCSIGERPIDLHLYALKSMGAMIQEQESIVFGKLERKFQGKNIKLSFPSVGATETAILAAVLAEGITIIENAAKEPEIIELCHFLQQMGAQIIGEGTDKIKIQGVDQLSDTIYKVDTDRIVTATYLSAVAGCGGSAFFRGNSAKYLESVLIHLQQIGTSIQRLEEGILIQSDGIVEPIPYLITKPYPGFPTDMQSQMLALLSIANGTSIVEETIFESRFKIAQELEKMGAAIQIKEREETKNNQVIVEGKESLHGAFVLAHDLRGGAALTIAGLYAQGITQIAGISYIERGYEDMIRDLSLLGATCKKRSM